MFIGVRNNKTKQITRCKINRIRIFYLSPWLENYQFSQPRQIFFCIRLHYICILYLCYRSTKQAGSKDPTSNCTFVQSDLDLDIYRAPQKVHGCFRATKGERGVGVE